MMTFENMLVNVQLIFRLGLALVATCLSLSLFGQVKVPAQDTSSKKIRVDFADLFEYAVIGKDTYQKLLGEVELRQDSIYMYCDSAIIKNETELTAMGRVLIQQGDSLSVFADSATYSSLTRKANLYREVVLLNGRQQLFTDSLAYDLTTKVATYNSGATLTDDTTQVTSKRGYYFVETRDVFFKEDVLVVSPDFSLKADTLKFNVDVQEVTFLGPTLISTMENGKIYCERGFYKIPEKEAEFTQNAQYEKEDQKAQGDTIRYNGVLGVYTLNGNASFKDGKRKASADNIIYDERQDKTVLKGQAEYNDGKQNIQAPEIIYDGRKNTYLTRGRSYVSDPPQILEADAFDFDNEKGIGLAIGNVIWRDTAQNVILYADRADYDKNRDYLKTRGGRPLLVSIVEGDSMFLRADTLVSFRRDTTADSQDSSRLLLAYNHVKIFKHDLQAVCDSLVYEMDDSLFYFYNNPMIWSDTSQFSADTILVRMADGQIDNIFLRQNAFIINSPDELFFNQVKGKDITAFFEQKELRRMLVEGNAESVYYALDDRKAYIGVNKTICSEMLLYFGSNQVEKIKFFAKPQATLTPMRQADHQSLKMSGFRWVTDIRPKSRFDL